MQDIHQEINTFFSNWSGNQADEIETLKQAGSNRQYFRVFSGTNSFIATYNPNNIPENNAFIEFSNHFTLKQLPVPEVLAVKPDKSLYLQSDFGDVSLYDIMQKAMILYMIS